MENVNIKYGEWEDMYNGTASHIQFRGRAVTIWENKNKMSGPSKYIARGDGLKYNRTPLEAISLDDAKVGALGLLEIGLRRSIADNEIAIVQISEFKDKVGGDVGV